MPTSSQPKTRQALPDAVAPEALRPWPFPALTPQQQVERRRMEQGPPGQHPARPAHLLRSALVIARSRAIELLVIFAVAAVVSIACTGCGGGDDQLDNAHPITTQPVDCGGGIRCQ